MPKNKSKGNKITKRGRSGSDEKRPESSVKEEDQDYMRVSSILGNCRLELEDQYGTKFLGIIRGKMRKRVYIKNRDLVLVSKRDFQDNKVDIIHKYGYSEISYLIRKQEIPTDFVDIDSMFSESTQSRTNKRKNTDMLDLPKFDSDNSETDISDNEKNDSDTHSSDLEFDNI
tara:strand:- start:444 stop:959 length:516 start_codon:yes stop_codon:yes gene_type:complete